MLKIETHKSMQITRCLLVAMLGACTTNNVGAAYRRTASLFGLAARSVCQLSSFQLSAKQTQPHRNLQSEEDHKNSKQHRVILVGAGGKKAMEYYDLLKDHVQFVGFIQPNPRPDIASLSRNERVPLYSDLPSLTKSVKFDGALVAVPHHLHFNYTDQLLRAGKFVIKEKPVGLTGSDLARYRAINPHDTPRLFTVVQRQFQQAFIQAKKDLDGLGPIYAFKYEYCLGLKDDTSGWRAQRAKSGGGVLLDAGYHIVDILHTFFGEPSRNVGQFAYTSSSRKEKLEDAAILLLSYPRDIHGVAIISRYGPHKKEIFEVLGERGAAIITPTEYTIYDRQGNMLKNYKSTRSKSDESRDMFLTYLDHVHDNDYIKQELQRHERNMQLIDAIYATQ